MPSPITKELEKAFREEFTHFRDTVTNDKKQRFDAILTDLATVVTPALASPNEEVRQSAVRNAKVLKTELLALATLTEIEAALRINAGIQRGIGVLTKALIAAI